MRKLLLVACGYLVTLAVSVSCRMAPKNDYGDTVAAKVFEPIDSAKLKAAAKDSSHQAVVDSTDIFYIGNATTKSRVMLVSYPSRRDTAVYSKGRHIRMVGKVDVGTVARAKFWVSPAGDTLVTQLQSIP